MNHALKFFAIVFVIGIAFYTFSIGIFEKKQVDLLEERLVFTAYNNDTFERIDFPENTKIKSLKFLGKEAVELELILMNKEKNGQN